LYAVRFSISLAILSEIFIQIGYFFKSYARKHKWMYFSEHSVEKSSYSEHLLKPDIHLIWYLIVGVR